MRRYISEAIQTRGADTSRPGGDGGTSRTSTIETHTRAARPLGHGTRTGRTSTRASGGVGAALVVGSACLALPGGEICSGDCGHRPLDMRTATRGEVAQPCVGPGGRVRCPRGVRARRGQAASLGRNGRHGSAGPLVKEPVLFPHGPSAVLVTLGIVPTSPYWAPLTAAFSHHFLVPRSGGREPLAVPPGKVSTMPPPNPA